MNRSKVPNHFLSVALYPDYQVPDLCVDWEVFVNFMQESTCVKWGCVLISWSEGPLKFDVGVTKSLRVVCLSCHYANISHVSKSVLFNNYKKSQKTWGEFSDEV